MHSRDAGSLLALGAERLSIECLPLSGLDFMVIWMELDFSTRRARVQTVVFMTDVSQRPSRPNGFDRMCVYVD